MTTQHNLCCPNFLLHFFQKSIQVHADALTYSMDLNLNLQNEPLPEQQQPRPGPWV